RLAALRRNAHKSRLQRVVIGVVVRLAEEHEVRGLHRCVQGLLVDEGGPVPDLPDERMLAVNRGAPRRRRAGEHRAERYDSHRQTIHIRGCGGFQASSWGPPERAARAAPGW